MNPEDVPVFLKMQNNLLESDLIFYGKGGRAGLLPLAFGC